MLLASALVVVAGMVVIILSRLILFRLKKSHEITIALYVWFIVAEIVLMGLFYTCLEIFVLHDTRTALALLFNAIQNTALILLIPYTLSILFFAWKDIKRKLDQMVTQFRDPTDIFIRFKDEKGQLRITIRLLDLLYLESNDNYVNINYLDKEKAKVFMIRNSLKNFETELKDYPIYRNHRKFAVNIKNVKLLHRVKKGFELVINNPEEDKLPVSRSYEKSMMEHLNIK